MTAITRISAFATTALMAPLGIAKAECGSTRLAERKSAKQSANSFLSFNFYTLAGWSSTTNQQLYDISYHDLLQPNSMMMVGLHPIAGGLFPALSLREQQVFASAKVMA